PASFATPAHASKDGTGIVVSTGTATVDFYQDFLCPICKQFESQASSTLDSMVAQKKIALVYHPIAILDDRTNPSGYSTRAAAAAACAADGNKYNTDTAAGKNIQGTPTVLVNGKQIQNTVNALQQAVG